MGSIAKAVMEHFADAGIRYAHPEDQSVFLAPFRLNSGPVMLACDCREQAQQLVACVAFPFSAAADLRPAAAEWITRVNCRLAVGAFTLDYADGELQFRAGIDVEGDRLTPALVRSLIACALTTADHFYPGLAAVAVAGVPPGQALDLVQAGRSRAQVLAALSATGGLSIDLQQRLN